MNNWASFCPSFFVNNNITISYLYEILYVIVLLINSKNTLWLLQINISAMESRSYKIFLKEEIFIAKTFDSQLSLKVRDLSFKMLDYLFLIFMSENLNFLH